jgi:hypothetical protein
MRKEMFEQLLHESEGSTLDFKQAQYKFVKASDDEKSELIKDILGFANGFRRSDAYILIGVREVKGSRGTVTGVAEHLDDHSLQQLLSSLTNRAVRFGYEAFEFESKQVAAIRIDLEQARPIYLRKDYGKLRRSEVYIRRGSATDRATPEEIALMGASTVSIDRTPLIRVEFAEVERDRALGGSLDLGNTCLAIPAFRDIPDKTERARSTPFGLEVSVGTRVNRDFYREYAEYEFARHYFRPCRLVVTNVGTIGAQDVRVVLHAQRADGVMAISTENVPDRPNADWFPRADLSGLRHTTKAPGDVEVFSDDELSRVELDCGVVQPGRRVWSDKFCLGFNLHGTVELRGEVFATGLPEPVPFALVINGNTVDKELSVAQLTSLADRATARG